MSEALSAGLGLATGAVAGTAFFLGLWWTVRRVSSAPNPAGLMAGSFLVRTALALGAFYGAAMMGWEALAGCVVTFLSARAILVRGIDPR